VTYRRLRIDLQGQPTYQKGKPGGTIACQKRSELGSRLPESELRDLDDMGKATLPEVQWRVGDRASLDTTAEIEPWQKHLVAEEL